MKKQWLLTITFFAACGLVSLPASAAEAQEASNIAVIDSIQPGENFLVIRDQKIVVATDAQLMDISGKRIPLTRVQAGDVVQLTLTTPTDNVSRPSVIKLQLMDR